MNEWMNEQMNEWTNERVNESMNERTNEWTTLRGADGDVGGVVLVMLLAIEALYESHCLCDQCTEQYIHTMLDTTRLSGTVLALTTSHTSWHFR